MLRQDAKLNTVTEMWRMNRYALLPGNATQPVELATQVRQATIFSCRTFAVQCAAWAGLKKSHLIVYGEFKTSLPSVLDEFCATAVLFCFGFILF